MEPRDREWIRPGLTAGLLSPSILEARFAETPFLDEAETERARRALDEDQRWLRTVPGGERRDVPVPGTRGCPPGP